MSDQSDAMLTLAKACVWACMTGNKTITITLRAKRSREFPRGELLSVGEDGSHNYAITYTLPEEGGASLRAAGWRLVGTRGGGTWSRPSRPRADTPDHLRGPKCLWRAPDGADKGKRHAPEVEAKWT